VARIPPSLGLARAVRGRRQELGLNRAQLAVRLGWRPGEARSGWSPRTIVRIEGGERGLRDAGEVVVMARGLELSEDDLTGAARAGGWTAGPGARGARGGEEELSLDGLDLVALLARLLAQLEEQTALLRRLVAATERAEGPDAGGQQGLDPAQARTRPGQGSRRRQ
jgi:hypothetical protein